MKNIAAISLLLAACYIGDRCEAEPATGQHLKPDSAQLDIEVSHFFDRFKLKKDDEAISALFALSPLMVGKVTDKSALAAQMQAARKTYGDLIGFEKADETKVGTMFIKRHYIAQHQNMLTRWEFDFVWVLTGWNIVYVGFEDQVRTW